MEQGLSQASIHALRKRYGFNKLSASSSSFSTLLLLISQFTTLINGILLAGGILAFFVGENVDAIFIFIVIFLNGIIGFIQEYNAERTLEKLKSYAVQIVRVIRSGTEVELDSQELLPGDIVLLSEGDRIPADGIILETHHMEHDESILTGESLPVLKEKGHSVYMEPWSQKEKASFK